MSMPEAAAPAQSVRWDDTSRSLEAEFGLHYPQRQWPALQRGLAAAARALGFADAADCAERICTGRLDARQRQVLARCLAIGETYFFRDPGQLQQLWHAVLAPLVQRRRGGSRHLRCWSAGCATGEEAWTLAMLLASRLPDWRDWNLSILATDFNDAALVQARAGRYGRWSLRGGVPPEAQQFLHPLADGRHEVDPALRTLVRFAPLNLAGGDHPSAANGTVAMDLVLCRNVLIYFTPDRGRTVLQRLGGALADGGWLVTNPVEIPAGGVPGLVRVHHGGLVALRRDTAPGLAPAAVAARACAPAAAPLPAPPPPPAQPAPPVSATAGAAAEDPAALAQRSRACADSGALVEAEHLCRQAIAQDGLDPELPYLLASILSERGALAAAASALQRTLYLAPQHLLARLALGSLAARQGQQRAAHRHFALALERVSGYGPQEVVPGSGGMTAGELARILQRAGAGQ